jgi:hypothetical protein
MILSGDLSKALRPQDVREGLCCPAVMLGLLIHRYIVALRDGNP